MRRFFMMIMFLALCAMSASAQFQDFERGNNNSNRTQRQRYRLQDHLRYGGNFGLSFGSQYLNVQVNPTVGYSFNRYATAGALFTYEYFKGVNYFGESFSNTTFGGGLFGEAYPIDFLVLHAEAQAISYEDSYHDRVNPERKWDVPVLIGGGYHRSISDRASVNVMLLWNLNATEGLRNNTTFYNPIFKVNFLF